MTDPGSAGFSVARLPRLEFGSGRISLLPELIAEHGSHVLLVTGQSSFRGTAAWGRLLAELDRRVIDHDDLVAVGEPSPGLVDGAVAMFRRRGIDVVAAVGGGSVLDTAKAVAGLLVPGNSVRDHLEGVGPELPYRGPALPFLAAPTTAGTGSEATKNAVLSERGADGYKKSFRDERLVAAAAIVDPDLLAACPAALVAADGMDALTQLLEAFTSGRASPFTDALARSGLAAARDGLLAWHAAPDGPAAPAARARMAYAAHLSGICLAQAGLGAVHGLASPLGAFFPIPHGVACGAVLVAATRTNIAALEARRSSPDATDRGLARYAEAGRLLADRPDLPDRKARQALLAELERWAAELAVPRLAAFGVGPSDVARLVAAARGSSMRTNPVELSDPEVAAIVETSL